MKHDYSWLENPEVFAVNRLPVCSDHAYDRSNGPQEFLRSLNGWWRFSYAEQLQAAPHGFWEQDYSCEDWALIQVPGHIQLQGYDRPHYTNTPYPWDGIEDIVPPQIPKKFNPVASYVTEFDLPEEWDHNRIYLRFGGVESCFYLWCNGQFVGYSEDSFSSVAFDLSPFVREHGNKLAVQVFKWCTGSWLEDQDFWRFSGIFRDVTLYTTPDCHIENLNVTASLNDAYTLGVLACALTVTAPCTVKVHLEDAAGTVIAARELNAAQAQALSFTIEELDILPWSAETPNLYTLHLTLTDHEGNLLEHVGQAVGFRRFELRDGLMCLNGKRMIFRGVNRHEFHCRTGRYLSPDRKSVV